MIIPFNFLICVQLTKTTLILKRKEYFVKNIQLRYKTYFKRDIIKKGS